MDKKNDRYRRNVYSCYLSCFVVFRCNGWMPVKQDSRKVVWSGEGGNGAAGYRMNGRIGRIGRDELRGL